MRDYRYITAGDCGAADAVENAGCQRTDAVQIKCRTYGAATIPADTEVGTTVSLVNLNVDTAGYQKPCVKVEFLSNILTDTATATLNFQIFRQCSGQLSAVPVSGIWTFSRTVATDAAADSFSFAVCDCDHCGCGCCNYSVVATVAGAATTGTVTINNATLMATIAEGAGC